MSEEVSVVLDLSPEVRMLLEQQDVDLYEEIQRELLSARREVQADPEAPKGSRDVVTVIAVTATLVTALTPIILRILNMCNLQDNLAKLGALCFTRTQVGERFTRFTLFQHFRPMIANHASPVLVAILCCN